MKNIINYSTPKSQVQKLISQNLIIQDMEYAEQALSTFGYSNLIKSYREPYVYTNENGKKLYRDNITFEQVQSLFLFDKGLRNSVMAAMQDLEEHVKEVAADVIAASIGTDPSAYLNMKNYRDRKKADPKFNLAYVLNTLQGKLKVKKYPILHYATAYGSVPPWILLKSVYFSTIITFISKFKPAEQAAVAERLYDYNSHNLTIDQCRMLMMDTLYICLDYRNTAAHGGRIYLLSPKSTLRKQEIFGNPHAGGTGYGQLLFLLGLLKYRRPYEQLRSILNKELTRHCNEYPNDSTYLAQALNINIEYKKFVFVSDATKKFHYNPHCSGLKNALQMELNDALSQGLTPCKRCIKAE